MTEDQFELKIEIALQCDYNLGKIVERENIGAELLSRSGKLFEQGKDELAKLVRELASECIATAKLRRANYDVVDRPQKSKAIAEIFAEMNISE